MARNWAILIGANEYEYPAALPPLRYAQRDAERLREFLAERAGFERTFLFTADASELRYRPSRSRVVRVLKELARRPELRSGDNLWFFFSGHGQTDGQGRDYLMLPESYPADVEETGLSVAWVVQTLRRCGADNVVLFLDACRDEARREGKGATGTGENAAALGREKCSIVVSSCSPYEASYELEALGHGAFTYSLLEALDAQNRCGTVEKIDRHLRLRVPDLVRIHKDARIEQNPRTVADPLHKQHLILLPDYATEGDLAVLERDALAAETEEAFELALQLWYRLQLASRGMKSEEYYRARRRIEARLEERQSAPFPSSSGGAKSPRVPQPPPAAQPPVARSDPPRRTRRAAPPLAVPLVVRSDPPRRTRRAAMQWLGFGGLAATTVALARWGVQWAEPEPEPSPTPEPEPEPSGISLQPVAFEVVTLDSRGEVAGRETRQASYFAEDLGDGVLLEMVQIPGGTFTRGSPESEEGRFDDEGPQREVTVPEFFLGKFAVTQAQWRRVAVLPKVDRDLDPDPASFKGDALPVERVSWNEAMAFCAWLSRATGRDYRLPSEAEWEYACRAGTTTPFHFGETIAPEFVNYKGNYPYGNGPTGQYRQRTVEVGSLPPNAFGLHEMHGNVWEWCRDTWHDSYEGAPTDGSARIENDNGFHSVRGGSWHAVARYCRSANRALYVAGSRYGSLGFRVALSAARLS